MLLVQSLNSSRRIKSGSSDRFYFLGLHDNWGWCCSHEVQRYLLLGRKYSILESRYITFSIKVHIVKAIIFVVVLYGCES